MFLNLNLESVWFDSGLKTFSSASNTSSGLSAVISADANICVASLPSQLINSPALCLSLRSHKESCKEYMAICLKLTQILSIYLSNPSQMLV